MRDESGNNIAKVLYKKKQGVQKRDDSRKLGHQRRILYYFLVAQHTALYCQNITIFVQSALIGFHLTPSDMQIKSEASINRPL